MATSSCSHLIYDINDVDTVLIYNVFALDRRGSERGSELGHF
jgi:hypothetical protein